MAVTCNLGFPRLGPNRELKRAVEGYWAGRLDEAGLQRAVASIRRQNWEVQRAAGLDHVPSNDFSLYDHVLDTAVMVGAVPERYGARGESVDLDTYFAMARGAPGGNGVAAMEMTKWFDTNYHYIVPELGAGQRFRLASTRPVDEFLDARALGFHTRPVLLGPVSFLLLAKARETTVDRLSLLEGLWPVYGEVLRRLGEAGADWIQVDEPCLGLTLDEETRSATVRTYERLAASAPGARLLVAVYFSAMRDNLQTALRLPVSAIHLDLVRGPGQLDQVIGRLPGHMSVSLGLVDGRNVWKTDLAGALGVAERAVEALGSGRVMVAPSCSLLHSPVDVELESDMDEELKSWLAFARQKVEEVGVLGRALNEGRDSVAGVLDRNAQDLRDRRTSGRIHNPEVSRRVAGIDGSALERSAPFEQRRRAQQEALDLPPLPTTTIGSFPQTVEIRKRRAALRRGEIGREEYEAFLREEIARAIRFQERAGLDMVVHGEPERTDMVEYFAGQLEGFASTTNGWVQSYGTRAVKPPIIFGDVRRPGPMTVDWIRYAQSLTSRPVKGMLTGPVTMLQWSFARDDQPRRETCRQIALAVRDEVADLERAGIKAVQIDEPAFREGLPLRREEWEQYLRWAVECFRLASSGAASETQVHTHMCYSEFNDTIQAIADLDADVISIEASRSNMELLEAFVRYRYPNDIGPGVYDIHSPRTATVEEVEGLLERALRVISPGQLWVNPDCGLKTRRWEEIEPSLVNLVSAARAVREGLR